LIQCKIAGEEIPDILPESLVPFKREAFNSIN
jgi:hypothetical protein